jgi:RNA polymerase sigma factor (sigma-70 family)
MRINQPANPAHHREQAVTSIEAGSSHTNWALIFDAAKGGDLPATTALEKLVRRYWPAVYAFIRRTGRDVHESADLTQGFVCDVILSRNLFEHADPSRGRFRSLLLSALQNYLREKHRHETRSKRSSGSRLLQLDEADLAAAEAAPALSPEQAFSAQWNATLIRQVLERVQTDCTSTGLEAHWAVFEARVVRPMLFGEPRVAYSRLVDRLRLDDAGQAANMMVTVKRRFVQALIDEVSFTVSDPLQIEEELRTLLRDVERNS